MADPEKLGPQDGVIGGDSLPRTPILRYPPISRKDGMWRILEIARLNNNELTLALRG